MLRTLGIQFNSINSAGLEIMRPFLRRFTNLVALDMSSNGTVYSGDDEACAALCDVFTQLPQLKRLDLSNNRARHKLRVLLTALPGGLEHLRVCGCGVSELDLAYLRRSHHSATLRELDLSDNVITHERYSYLSSLLTALAPRLCVLELEECTLEPTDLCTFIDHVLQLQKLKFINLARNDSLNEDMIHALVRSLARLPALAAVKLSYPTDCYVSVEPDEVNPVKLAFRYRLHELVSAVCAGYNRRQFDLSISGP